MTKRGFLLPETLVNVLVGVVCLLILLGLVSYLFFAYKNNKEFNKAKEIFPDIINLVEGRTSDVLVTTSILKDWSLVLFSKQDGFKFPSVCDSSKNTCLCLCKFVNGKRDELISVCSNSKKSICSSFQESLSLGYPSTLDDPSIASFTIITKPYIFLGIQIDFLSDKREYPVGIVFDNPPFTITQSFYFLEKRYGGSYGN